MSSLLDRLALQPTAYAALPSDACERVADFLLRWQAYAEALACLDALGTLSPTQLEQRAAALHGLGRTSEALALLDQRLRRQDSLPAAIQRVRMQAAAGQVQPALAAAQSLADKGATPYPATVTGGTRKPIYPASGRPHCCWATCCWPPATLRLPRRSTCSCAKTPPAAASRSPA